MTDKATTDCETASILLTSDIVAAYVGNNSVPRSDLAPLIVDIYAAIERLRSGPVREVQQKPTPAVPIKRSITADYIVCLEDGKKFKSLKRHLSSRYGLTPDEYRAKWDLPLDYPMVAPAYAAARSMLAKSMGLGRIRKKVSVVEAVQAKPKRKRTARNTLQSM